VPATTRRCGRALRRKFGVPAERAVDVLADAAERGFDVVGIHAHVGSGVSSDQLERPTQEFVARMGDLSREGADAVGDLEFVDVGGGFGVPYREAGRNRWTSSRSRMPLETRSARSTPNWRSSPVATSSRMRACSSPK